MSNNDVLNHAEILTIIKIRVESYDGRCKKKKKVKVDQLVIEKQIFKVKLRIIHCHEHV